jgi:large subunit ribosomal protein L4
MLEVPIYNTSGQKVDTWKVEESLLGGRVNVALLKQAIVIYHANRRQGTVRTKSRADVEGSTRKLYKQKGTGNARHGSIRAPIYVGGGQAHPPRPRDWSYRPPRQVRIGALRSALSKFAKEGNLIVVDKIELKEIKTKGLLSALTTLKTKKKVMIVDSADNENVKLSIRNCRDHQFLPPEGVNVFDLLRHDTLIVSKDAAKKLEARCLDGEGK